MCSYQARKSGDMRWIKNFFGRRFRLFFRNFGKRYWVLLRSILSCQMPTKLGGIGLRSCHFLVLSSFKNNLAIGSLSECFWQLLDCRLVSSSCQSIYLTSAFPSLQRKCSRRIPRRIRRCVSWRLGICFITTASIWVLRKKMELMIFLRISTMPKNGFGRETWS